MRTELHAVISGHVQGVGYRDFVREAAEALDLKGWVANNPDSSVELVVQGYPDALKDFQTRLVEGSILARVDAVASEFRTLRVAYDDFSVRI